MHLDYTMWTLQSNEQLTLSLFLPYLKKHARISLSTC